MNKVHSPTELLLTALRIFFQRLLQDLHAEHPVGDDPLQPRVLLLQLFEPLGLVGTHHAELLPPAVEGLFADAVLADHLRDALPCLGFPQDADPLFCGVAFTFHSGLGPFGFVVGPRLSFKPGQFSWAQPLGGRCR